MCVLSNGRFPLALVQSTPTPTEGPAQIVVHCERHRHRRLRAHHLRLRADVWHFRHALGVQHARTDAEYGFWGCEYRADPNNQLFGHLDQVLDNGGGVVLLRYPLCGVIYQRFDDGSDRLLRLSLDEAESILPSSEWTVVPWQRLATHHLRHSKTFCADSGRSAWPHSVSR
jgi:hypothetical protein